MDLTCQQFTLPNGLRLVYAPMNTDSVTVLLLVRVGSRDETAKLNGISHFFEHMVFKGTKKWPSPMELNRVIDSVGGVFNAFTSQEHTGFWVKIAKQHLPLGLEFIQELMFASLLPAGELEKERGVILEEIKMIEDNPMRFVYDQFVSQVYSKTALGRPIIGKPENIKAVQRADFTTHLARWYQPKNMVLAVAGGAGQDLPQLADAVLGCAGKDFASENREKITVKPQQNQVNLVNKPIQQLHFCLGLTTFARGNPDRYALSILNLILGGNTSSRLWDEIREKRGLVYYIRSGTDSYFDTGYWVIQGGCDLARGEEAVKVSLNELRRLPEKITGEEVTNAREYIKGHLALSLEDSQDVADLFGEDLLIEGKIRTLEEIIAGIEAVTPERVQALAKKLLAGVKLNLTVLGPVKDQEKFAKLL